MVQLTCAVFDHGAVFPVNIALDATVEVLKKAIVEAKQGQDDRFRVDPVTLRVYVARKNSEWLKNDGDVQTGDSTEYVAMDSSWVLNRTELFGPEFTPNEGDVHVLVDLPDAVTSDDQDKPVSMALEEGVSDLPPPPKKRKRYEFSEIDLMMSRRLFQQLQIHVEPVQATPFTVDTASLVAPFKWGTAVKDEAGQQVAITDEQQRMRYREYMEHNIGDVLAEKKLCVLRVDKDSNVLATAVPGHDVEFAGQPDLLVLGDIALQHADDVRYLPGVQMLIDVKEKITGDDNSQTIWKLVALDIHAINPVMALVTDLNSKWRFSWVAEISDTEAMIHVITIDDPGAAFEVIKSLLKQSDTETTLPCFPGPVKRVKLSPWLEQTGDGGPGIGEAIRQYYDIASVLGPDIEMARAIAARLVRTIPAFSTYE